MGTLNARAERLAATNDTENDRNDTIIVNKIVANHVDFVITEDRGMHTKTRLLGVADRVFTIDAFLGEVTAENPTLMDYKVLAVKKTVFGKVDVTGNFFDSFR